MKIIPAILPRNYNAVYQGIDMIKGHSNEVQIDICDGKFVPTITWPYWKSEEKMDLEFELLIKEYRGLLEWDTIDYEFDLMILEPSAEDARNWLAAGASKIILHIESSSDLDPAIAVLDGLVQIGIAINNTTDISKLNKYLGRFQYIQIMGIRKAGFQGQNFEMDTLEKIKEVKKAFPDVPVQIDGGVTLENAKLIKEAGADRIVSGSALFDSYNIVDTLEQFRSI